MKCVLDTNIYIHAINSEKGESVFLERFVPLIFRTYIAAIVVEELYAGATDIQGIRLVERYVGSLERAGRIVYPTFQDWKDAGQLVARMTKKEPSRKPKVQQMLNDILLALCARQIGATLFTYNRDDFRLIGRHLPFECTILER